jgi:hypothetical protein
LCVSTRNYGNWWKCRVMARAFARPVLQLRTVPDRVIHIPSWENGWAQVRKKHGERSKISCQDPGCQKNLSSTVLEGCLRIDIAWQVAWPIDKSTIDQRTDSMDHDALHRACSCQKTSSLDDRRHAGSSSWWSLRKRRAPGPIVCGLRRQRYAGSQAADLVRPVKGICCAITEHLASQIY